MATARKHDLLTTAEAGQALGVTDGRIRQMVLAGEIKAYRFGRRSLLIDRREVDRVLESRGRSAI